MLTLEENMVKEVDIGLNKQWFSQTTKCIRMISCIYFTATRSIKACDIINVFENILHLGIIYDKYINIVPVPNKNYNHVFLKIQWNDSIETANFVNELVINSSIKIYHNKGYWVCRMSRNPLKLRTSKQSVNVASFYYNHSDSESASQGECEEEENVTMQIKEEEDSNEEENSNEEEISNEEEDFYVIKEEIVATAAES